jgi:hypothetical protein
MTRLYEQPPALKRSGASLVVAKSPLPIDRRELSATRSYPETIDPYRDCPEAEMRDVRSVVGAVSIGWFEVSR